MFGTRQQLAKFTDARIRVGGYYIDIDVQATNLGVHLDSELKMLPHVQFVARTCYYQLRQLRSIRRSLTTNMVKSLVQALILTCLDYCNSALFGAPSTVLNRLQSVLNASAKLIARRRKFDHISAFMHDDLHWLPIRERIEYKLCLQTYKCLHGTAPIYLMVHCQSVAANIGRRNLRSAANGTLQVPATKSVYGSRGFSVSGPQMDINLPNDLRKTSLSLQDYKEKRKTFLFRKAYY